MRSWLLVSLCFLNCAPVAADEAGFRTEAIFNGIAAPNEKQVFLLDVRPNVGSGAVCSAVLISPRVLLTAAHCVDPAHYQAQSVTVRAMNKPDITGLMLSDTITVLTISRHPMWNAVDQESDYDLAVLLLTAAPAGVTPAPLAATFPNAVGAVVKSVGYGRVSNVDTTSAGTRRAAMLTVTAATTLNFTFGNATSGLCSGDSGGPSFLATEVVGIHSRTPGSATCDEGIDIRVDAHRAFIEAFIATNDPPLCTADTRCGFNCPTPDPDCPCAGDGTCNTMCGLNDPDCRCSADGSCGSGCGLSDPDCCADDGVCGSGCGMDDIDCRCGADGACAAACGSRDIDCRCQADTRCDMGCTPVDVDCPRCVVDGRCDATCGLTDADCLDDGTQCSDAARCVGGLCVNGTCSRTCGDDGSCRDGMKCQNAACASTFRAGCSVGDGVWLFASVLLLSRRRRTVHSV